MRAHPPIGVTCLMAVDPHPDDPLATEPLHVGVARFSGIDGAERAFADVREREPGAAWIGDAAFVEAHRRGRIVVRGSVAGRYVDLDGRGDVIGRDTGIGAVVGAAVGLLLGPPAFAVGVVGGATVGGVVEASHISPPEGPAFDAIREQVPQGASAIVVVSDAERVRHDGDPGRRGRQRRPLPPHPGGGGGAAIRARRGAADRAYHSDDGAVARDSCATIPSNR
jgi:hypothetical protein